MKTEKTKAIGIPTTICGLARLLGVSVKDIRDLGVREGVLYGKPVIDIRIDDEKYNRVVLSRIDKLSVLKVMGWCLDDHPYLEVDHRIHNPSVEHPTTRFFGVEDTTSEIVVTDDVLLALWLALKGKPTAYAIFPEAVGEIAMKSAGRYEKVYVHSAVHKHQNIVYPDNVLMLPREVFWSLVMHPKYASMDTKLIDWEGIKEASHPLNQMMRFYKCVEEDLAERGKVQKTGPYAPHERVVYNISGFAWNVPEAECPWEYDMAFDIIAREWGKSSIADEYDEDGYHIHEGKAICRYPDRYVDLLGLCYAFAELFETKDYDVDSDPDGFYSAYHCFLVNMMQDEGILKCVHGCEYPPLYMDCTEERYGFFDRYCKIYMPE